MAQLSGLSRSAPSHSALSDFNIGNLKKLEAAVKKLLNAAAEPSLEPELSSAAKHMASMLDSVTEMPIADSPAVPLLTLILKALSDLSSLLK